MSRELLHSRANFFEQVRSSPAIDCHFQILQGSDLHVPACLRHLGIQHHRIKLKEESNRTRKMHDEPSISGLMAGRTRKWREESRHVFRGEFKVQSGSSHLFVIGITAPSVPETAPAGLDGVEGYSVV